MDANLTQSLEMDSREFQNMIRSALSEAVKSMPEAKVPSWMEATAEFIRMRPLTSLLIALLVILVISAIIRELICAYLKTNEILSRLNRIEEKIKK